MRGRGVAQAITHHPLSAKATVKAMV